MKEIALLEYLFIFEPGNTWQTGSKFEQDLKDFFSANGLEADIVETRGSSSRRVMYITRIEPDQTPHAAPPTQAPVVKPSQAPPKDFKRFPRHFGVPINAKVQKKDSQTSRVGFKQRVVIPKK